MLKTARPKLRGVLTFVSVKTSSYLDPFSLLTQVCNIYYSALEAVFKIKKR